MRTDVGGSEDVRVDLFFRDPADGGAVERTVLAAARGHVMDLGAGAGAFAVALSGRGHRVTALELLPAACEVLIQRGIEDVRQGGLDSLGDSELFDTILVMMNGLGLAGTLQGLAGFLGELAGHLAPGGRILADSTDPSDWGESDDGRYPGEVHMQLSCGGVAGEPFPFLFIDAATLEEVAAGVGLGCKVIARDEDGRFLALLAPR
jgi:SAM-dependent methyltransferase